MTTVNRSLRWRSHANEFDADEKRILLALSHQKWAWRTLENLQAVTRLDSDVLEEKLDGLIRNRLVKGSIYKPNTSNARPIFGLVERDTIEGKKRRKFTLRYSSPKKRRRSDSPNGSPGPLRKVSGLRVRSSRQLRIACERRASASGPVSISSCVCQFSIA